MSFTRNHRLLHVHYHSLYILLLQYLLNVFSQVLAITPKYIHYQSHLINLVARVLKTKERLNLEVLVLLVLVLDIIIVS